MLDVAFFDSELTLQYPNFDYNVEIINEMMKDMVTQLSESRLPFVEIIDLFRLTDKLDMPDGFDLNNVSQRDFQDKIVRDCLKFSSIMTPNKARFLGDYFKYDKDESYVEILRFEEQLLETARTLGKLIFQTQADIDEYFLMQKERGKDAKGVKVSD